MARKRKYPRGPAAQRKIRRVLHEHRLGKLRSSSGQKVTNRKQAIAIALSEARRQGRPRRRRRRVS